MIVCKNMEIYEKGIIVSAISCKRWTGETISIIPYFLALSLMELGDNRGTTDSKERLDYLDNTIRYWNPDSSRILDCDSEEFSKFLEAVAEMLQLVSYLNSCQPSKEGHDENGILGRVHIIHQIAMTRLGDVLVEHLGCHLIESNMSFRSENGLPDDFSTNSFREDFVQARQQMNENYDSEGYLIDLISPNVLQDIIRIARVMVMSNYDMECCQSYIAVRRDALDEYLSFLCMEKYSIDEVSRMKWDTLDRKIGKWIKVVKVFVRVYLASEKRLCDHIFGGLSRSVSKDCFFQTAKGPIMQLLNFGEAVALGTPSVEKLFRILDVFDTLYDLLPDIESLNLEDSGFCVMNECKEILSRLSGCAREILLMLKDKIKNESTPPSVRGGFHPLSRYVMNYILLMAAYRGTISLIFGCSDGENVSPSFNGIIEASSGNTFSLTEYLVSVMSTLESNLDTKSLSYKNPSLQHLFMMNNISYMVRKVRKNPDLTCLFGDIWIRAHIVKYRQHSILYERDTWSPVVSILTEKENPSQKFGIKMMNRIKDFNHAFEEVYMVQTAWKIPDEDLRKELRISISLKVVPAYRAFTGRHAASLDAIRHAEKYIKFSQDDLEKYLLDLFEGYPKSFPIHH